MNRQETLEWIDIILDSFDDREMMAIINESAGQFDGEFFDTVSQEIKRYEQINETDTAQRLERVARAIASVRQNRAENL